jgi:hypothetical protein
MMRWEANLVSVEVGWERWRWCLVKGVDYSGYHRPSSRRSNARKRENQILILLTPTRMAT